MLDRSSRFGHPSGSIRRAAFHFPSRSGFGSQPCEDDAVTRDAVNDGNAEGAAVRRQLGERFKSIRSGSPQHPVALASIPDRGAVRIAWQAGMLLIAALTSTME